MCVHATVCLNARATLCVGTRDTVCMSARATLCMCTRATICICACANVYMSALVCVHMPLYVWLHVLLYVNNHWGNTYTTMITITTTITNHNERITNQHSNNHNCEQDEQHSRTYNCLYFFSCGNSLRKNRNKTEETSKWLERRITSLNDSITSIRDDVRKTVFTSSTSSSLTLFSLAECRELGICEG